MGRRRLSPDSRVRASFFLVESAVSCSLANKLSGAAQAVAGCSAAPFGSAVYSDPMEGKPPTEKLFGAKPAGEWHCFKKLAVRGFVYLCRHREITFGMGSNSPGRRSACAAGSVLNSKWCGEDGALQVRRRHGEPGAELKDEGGGPGENPTMTARAAQPRLFGSRLANVTGRPDRLPESRLIRP
jgi:hypothetical protein